MGLMALVLPLAAQAQMCRFDFGSAVAAEGYTAVSAATLYSDALGFGFEPGYTPSEVVRKKGTALTAKSGDEVQGVYVGANAKET